MSLVGCLGRLARMTRELLKAKDQGYKLAGNWPATRPALSASGALLSISPRSW